MSAMFAYLREASASLLVQRIRAVRRPQTEERATSTALTLFLFINQPKVNEVSPETSINRWIAYSYFQKRSENSDNDALYPSPLETPIPASIVDFVNPHVSIRLLFA